MVSISSTAPSYVVVVGAYHVFLFYFFNLIGVFESTKGISTVAVNPIMFWFDEIIHEMNFRVRYVSYI